ncbi:DUF5955 family protein [Actinacidiphila sp. ITFR-21]|uniref:DUF5955 family protein n=1 Tax=Actinacidiphila sp. ITFR-21 TaxID=3075199 RepID=UPI00288A2846|nr:DUF5955 family protein [Streptomyces sp. ITFR-21]WNI18566.1 DUF5955 family protein [Streptomyces sp. ITFR-21]
MVGETQVLNDDRSGTAARPGGGGAPGGAVAGLHDAVAWLRRELAAYRPLLPDRAVAEDELDELAVQAAAAGRAGMLPETERLRHSLLLVAAALGSVSALTAPLDALRQAVEILAPPYGGRR